MVENKGQFDDKVGAIIVPKGYFLAKIQRANEFHEDRKVLFHDGKRNERFDHSIFVDT